MLVRVKPSLTFLKITMDGIVSLSEISVISSLKMVLHDRHGKRKLAMTTLADFALL